MEGNTGNPRTQGNANRNRVRRRGRENEVEERRTAGLMAVALAPIYRLPEPFNRSALFLSPSAPRRRQELRQDSNWMAQNGGVSTVVLTLDKCSAIAVQQRMGLSNM